MTIQYDGSRFHGWQSQNTGVRTVQGEMEQAISALFSCEIQLYASGRTDVGVHAMGQTAHMTLNRSITEERLRVAINQALPHDIFVSHIKQVSSNFHARYDACEKTYQYVISQAPDRTPFGAHYFYHHPKPLDVKAMKMAAQFLIGTHDFAPFMAAGSDKTNTIRTIFEIHVRDDSIEKMQDVLVITFRGDGFLYKMVRMMVALLIDIGSHRYSPEHMQVVLKSNSRQWTTKVAPAHGLYLWSVTYPHEQYHSDETKSNSVIFHQVF